MIGLCEYCGLKYADCKGNKDLEKLKCDYYKKRPVQNVKQMAERIAELEAEVDRLRNVQNMHSGGLISRADAIKAVQKIVPYVIDKDTGQWGIPVNKANVITELSALPSAETKWIPCSERLPKAEDMYQPPEQRYLCQLEAYGEKKFCVLSRLKGAVSPFWDWYGIAVYDSEVTAWMPLPEPYREDGEPDETD